MFKFLIEPVERRILLASLPTGFSEALVADDLPTPTSMAFAPDGRIFVAQQSGEVRVIKDGRVLDEYFAVVQENSVGERGLMGITLDPTFGQLGGDDYVYIYYTTGSPSIHNRVSRFTAAGDVADGSGETVLVDFPDLGGPVWHMGGAMNFGADGKLYIAHGDAQDQFSAQNFVTVNGKILRFNRDGSIPTDNPFYGTTTGIFRSIWALGLRNPFTTAWQPGTGRFYINDVGQETWEEINVGSAGANYGWPYTEGDFDQQQYPGYTRPALAYHHSEGLCIVGGAFYNPAATYTFPAQYHGLYFYGDFVMGWIKTLNPDTGTVGTFATDADWITGLGLAPDGSIWYMTRGIEGSGNALGKIYVIQYTPEQAPLIVQQPRDQTIAVGEDVTFSVSASGAQPLSYQWQRDGVDIPGATSTSYTLPGVSFDDSGDGFRVIVTNAFGTATSVAGVLTVANTTRPVPTIDTPLVGALYSGGDVISFSGSAIDEQDGTLGPAAFSWRVDLHHDEHSHPFMPPTGGIASGSFTIPTSGETSDNVFYRITLTVTDSDGLSQSTSRDVLPLKSTLTLKTNLPGLTLQLDGLTHALPYSVVGVQALERVITAPLTQTLAGDTYEFVAWSDGGANQHSIIFPSADATYTAYYRRVVSGAVPEVLNGTASADTWTLKLGGGGNDLHVWFNADTGGAPTQTIALATLASLTINGLGGDDELVLDLSGGAFGGVRLITFDGGANDTSVPGDALRFIGTGTSEAFDLSDSGAFVAALPVMRTGVERVSIDSAGGDDRVNLFTSLGAGASLALEAGAGSNTLAVFGGTHTFTDDLGALSPGLNVAVHNTANVTFGASQHLRTVALTGSSHAALSSGGAKVLRTGGLTFSAHGTLDLADNDLILDYTGSTPLAGIIAAIYAARNFGVWDGDGLTSSIAAVHPSGATTLGVLEAADYLALFGPGTPFAGEPIDGGNAILVKYTWLGDSDLNGTIDFDDFVRIDSGFNNAYGGWLNGDFDHNGVIDFDDYVLIDLAYNVQDQVL